MREVKKRYSKCNTKFKLKTVFDQDSYDVSYGLGIVLAVTVLNYIFRETIIPTLLMITFLIALVLLLPIRHSLSKIIWAKLFIKYNKDAVSNYKIILQDDSRTKK